MVYVTVDVIECSFRSELNLGVEQTGFTIVKCYKPSEEMEPFVRVCRDKAIQWL